MPHCTTTHGQAAYVSDFQSTHSSFARADDDIHTINLISRISSHTIRFELTYRICPHRQSIPLSIGFELRFLIVTACLATATSIHPAYSARMSHTCFYEPECLDETYNTSYINLRLKLMMGFKVISAPPIDGEPSLLGFLTRPLFL